MGGTHTLDRSTTPRGLEVDDTSALAKRKRWPSLSTNQRRRQVLMCSPCKQCTAGHRHVTSQHGTAQRGRPPCHGTAWHAIITARHGTVDHHHGTAGHHHVIARHGGPSSHHGTARHGRPSSHHQLQSRDRKDRALSF